MKQARCVRLSEGPKINKMDDVETVRAYESYPLACSRAHALGTTISCPLGLDMAILYRSDGKATPAIGVIVIGKIEVCVETFMVPGEPTKEMS